MVKRRTDLAYHSVKYVLFVQALMLLLMVIVSGALFGFRTAYSVLCGGAICIGPQYFFAKYFFAKTGASQIKRVLFAFWLGEIAKIVITVFLLYICFTVFAVNPGAMLLAYISMYVLFVLGPFLVRVR